MNTSNTSGLNRLVYLMVLLFAVVPKGMCDTSYDAVIVAHRITRDRPDPYKPFTAWTGSNGEEASNANLYLSSPAEQINNPNTRVYVSALIMFRSRDTGEFVAVHSPTVKNISFGFAGRKYRNGYSPQSGGGSFNVDATGSVFTDIAETNPNPTTGKAWIYGVHDGQVVTQPGSKVRLSEADGAIKMNPGNGDFMINPNPDLLVSQLWIVGVEQTLSAGFKEMYNNAVSLAGFGVPFDIVIEVTNSIAIDARLNEQNGCRRYATYEAFRFPTIYCGTEKGPVRPELELSADGRQLTLKYGSFGDWIVRSTTDLSTGWTNLPPWKFKTSPGFNFATEDRRHMTLTLPDPTQISSPPPKKMFFEVYSPRPPRPPQ